MTGGTAADQFEYGTYATISAQTGITLATADLITDFVSGTDKIKTGTAGVATDALATPAVVTNYVEAAAVADFTTALAAATTEFNANTTTRYYLTSITGGPGLLFTENTAATAAGAVISLTGITSANFALTDITL